MKTPKNASKGAIIAVASLMAIALPATVSPAMAGSKPKVQFGVHIGSGPAYGPAYEYGYAPYYYGNPCRWLKRRWLRTGHPKWRWRYRRCLWRYH